MSPEYLNNLKRKIKSEIADVLHREGERVMEDFPDMDDLDGRQVIQTYLAAIVDLYYHSVRAAQSDPLNSQTPT